MQYGTIQKPETVVFRLVHVRSRMVGRFTHPSTENETDITQPDNGPQPMPVSSGQWRVCMSSHMSSHIIDGIRTAVTLDLNPLEILRILWGLDSLSGT